MFLPGLHCKGKNLNNNDLKQVADQHFSLKKDCLLRVLILAGSENCFCPLLFKDFHSESTGFENLENLHATFSLWFDVGP